MQSFFLFQSFPVITVTLFDFCWYDVRLLNAITFVHFQIYQSLSLLLLYLLSIFFFPSKFNIFFQIRNLILNITGRALELVLIIIFVPGMNLFLLTGLGLELELHHPIYPSPCSEDLEYKWILGVWLWFQIFFYIN